MPTTGRYGIASKIFWVFGLRVGSGRVGSGRVGSGLGPRLLPSTVTKTITIESKR
jgi:hypothetical protein